MQSNGKDDWATVVADVSSLPPQNFLSPSENPFFCSEKTKEEEKDEVPPKTHFSVARKQRRKRKTMTSHLPVKEGARSLTWMLYLRDHEFWANEKKLTQTNT